MSIRLQSFLLLCCLALAAVGSVARARPAAYQLGPSDVLSVIVDKHPEFSAEQITVTPAGVISLPVVDSVRVTGKTLEQLEAEITRA
jgi:protein involved in polysaccharide export with SLBB domain